jgi:hypothetical protein
MGSIPVSLRRTGRPDRDKNAGRARSRELSEHVRELQRVRVRLGRADGGRWAGASRLAVAYAIWHEFEGQFLRGTLDGDGDLEQIGCIRRQKQTKRENPPGPTIPAIDHNLKGLARRRREAERELRRNRGREPYDIEIATEVVKAYSESETLVKTALKKLERLATELKTFEYVHLGVDIDDYFDARGELILRVSKRKSTKRPLPPPRRD